MSEAAEFNEQSKSRVRAWLESTLELLAGCLFLLLAGAALLGLARSPKPIGDKLALCFGILTLIYVSSVSFKRVYIRIRYRYMNSLSCKVMQHGISVQGKEENYLLEWTQFVNAEYLPLVPAYRLWPLSRPISPPCACLDR